MEAQYNRVVGAVRSLLDKADSAHYSRRAEHLATLRGVCDDSSQNLAPH